MCAATDYRIDVDRSEQILRLGIEARELWPGERELYAIPGFTRRPFVSSALLALKAKQFDDGLYAAIDIAVQTGLGRMPSKAALLNDLSAAIERIEESNEVLDTLIAARFAAGSLSRLPPERENASRLVETFFAGSQCKPLGYYTWTDALRSIFLQDRLLQTPLQNLAEIHAAARQIESEPGLRDSYETLLRFVTQITNPFARPHLLEDGAERSVIPPSRTTETMLVTLLRQARVDPAGISIIESAFNAVRSGHLSLKPREGDGWYQHVLYSIEPLIRPDIDPQTSRLVLTGSYLRHLRQLAHSFWAMARETHVKPVDIDLLGCTFNQRVSVGPDLTVEPLADHYLRRARSYSFLRTVLNDAFGPDAWILLQRLRESGQVPLPLGEELDAMESLFYGAYATVNAELGCKPVRLNETRDLEADKARFKKWASGVASDLDCGADIRMMVPLAFGPGPDQIRVWAIFGWTYSNLEVSFAQEPKCSVTLEDGSVVEPIIDCVPASYTVWQPVAQEFTVSRLLDRSEFRQHCDRGGSADEIIKRIQVAGRNGEF